MCFASGQTLRSLLYPLYLAHLILRPLSTNPRDGCHEAPGVGYEGVSTSPTHGSRESWGKASYAGDGRQPRPRWEANRLLLSFRHCICSYQGNGSTGFPSENKILQQAQESGVTFRFGSLACLIDVQRRTGMSLPGDFTSPPKSGNSEHNTLHAAF